MPVTPPADCPGWGLVAQMQILIDAADPRFTMLSTLEDVDDGLSRLHASIRTSVWNMQRHVTIYDVRDAATFDDPLRRRGVELRYILPPAVAERRCPLVSSYEPRLRLAAVGNPLMILDGRTMLVGSAAADSVWTTSDPGFVAQGVRLYDHVWRGARRAVPEGEDPPFSRRMLAIAFRLVDGATDREIARALDVSERTVSADIREMTARLGARSRAHAIALISGVEG